MTLMQRLGVALGLAATIAFVAIEVPASDPPIVRAVCILAAIAGIAMLLTGDDTETDQ